MWSEDELWAKGKLYVQRALEVGREDSLYPFWMSLALEFLARAALSKISPVLNADQREEKNILFGLGIETSGTPKTIPLHTVYSRCERLVQGFEKSHRNFCDFLGFQRNEELHTGGLPFENLKLQDWLKDYFTVVEVLCRHLERSLEDLLGNVEGGAARELLLADSAQLESSVKEMVAAHMKVFDGKLEAEKSNLREEARVGCRFPDDSSKRVDCPSCSSPNLVRGREIGRSRPYYEDGNLLEEVTMLSQSYYCHACGLNLPTLAHIQWSGIELEFTVEVWTDLHEHQEFDYYYDEYRNE